MKTLILHIGRHKTGTSALQYFLSNNKEFLDGLGVIYPRCGRINANQIAHHEIPLLFKQKAWTELQVIKNRLIEECRNYNTILLSSEEFQNLKDPKEVRDWLQGFRIVTVCYLREILSYKMSAYQQKIHAQGVVIGFKAFAWFIHLNYSKFVDNWRNASDKIILRLFQTHSLYRKNTITDFCRVVFEKEIPETKSVVIRNHSIGGNLLYYKLTRNYLKLSQPNEYKILNEISLLKKDYSGPFGIDIKLQEHFRKCGNNQFLKKIFGDLELIDFSNFPKIPCEESLDSDFELFNSYFKTPLNIFSSHFVQV